MSRGVRTERARVRVSLVLFAVVISAALPSSALGSFVFVHHEFQGAIYDAAGGEANDLTVSETAGTVTFVDLGAVIAAGNGCVQVSAHEATCAGVGSAFALLNDLNDSASVIEQDRASMSFEGGEGNDHLTICSHCHGRLLGDAGKDILQGGNEGSELIAGGAGSDTLTGGAGRDFIFGEAGADFIFGRAGNDVIGGGLGSDDLHGNRGSDRLRAKDGFLDLVAGGRGLDAARVDQSDVVRLIETILF
jgi:Ca2+-binding RTX toxin-like protein